MAEGSSGKPQTMIDSLHGDSVQVGDNNKKHVYNNCIFSIHHHHHHHHHHHSCGHRCSSHTTSDQEHVIYIPDQEGIEMEVLQNMNQLGESIGESVNCVTQGEITEKSHNPETVGLDKSTDSVKIIDTWGCELRVGDVVGLHSIWSYLFPTAIYVGDGMIVRCDEDTGLIIKEELNLRKTFYKRGVTYGSVPVYSRAERVKRAEGRVGNTFTEGHKKDFVCWCFTGVTNMKALRQVILGP